ncbi:MAG: hypothetical protein AB2563_20515 [Candidatus Thiodiazotropha endolucinida]
MSGIVIFQMDLWPRVKEQFRPKMLTIDKILVEVTFPNNPKLQAAFKQDPLLYQKLQDKIRAYMTGNVVRNLGNVVNKFDPQAVAAAKIDDMEEMLKILDKFQETAKGYTHAASTMAARQAEKVWMELTRTKAEYRKYKIVAGAKLTAGTAGLATGVGMTVGSTVATVASGGAAAVGTWASLTLGIIGILKSSVGLGKDIYNLAISADTVQKKIIKSLEKLQARYLDIIKGKKVGPGRSKATVMATELNYEAVRTVFGTSQTTISECDRMTGQFHDKLNGIDLKSHELSKKLEKVLTETEKLKKLKPKRIGEIEKLEKTVHKIIEKTIELASKVKDSRKAHKTYTAALSELKARKPNTGWLEKGFGYGWELLLSASDPKDIIVAAVGIATDLSIDASDKVASRVIKQKYKVGKR